MAKRPSAAELIKKYKARTINQVRGRISCPVRIAGFTKEVEGMSAANIAPSEISRVIKEEFGVELLTSGIRRHSKKQCRCWGD